MAVQLFKHPESFRFRCAREKVGTTYLPWSIQNRYVFRYLIYTVRQFLVGRTGDKSDMLPQQLEVCLIWLAANALDVLLLIKINRCWLSCNRFWLLYSRQMLVKNLQVFASKLSCSVRYQGLNLVYGSLVGSRRCSNLSIRPRADPACVLSSPALLLRCLQYSALVWVGEGGDAASSTTTHTHSRSISAGVLCHFGRAVLLSPGCCCCCLLFCC